MDEHVLAAVVARHETEALGVVEPLDLAADGDRGRGIGRDAARGTRRIAERTLRALDDPGGVDLDDARHLRALGAGADGHLEFGAGRDAFMSRGMQGVGVQKSVALAVRQLDESVALVRLEPFDDGVDRRPADRRGRRAAAAERRPAKTAVRGAAESTRRARLRLVGHRPVVVETALARRPKILTLAHVKLFLRPIKPRSRLRLCRRRFRRIADRRRNLAAARRSRRKFLGTVEGRSRPRTSSARSKAASLATTTRPTHANGVANRRRHPLPTSGQGKNQDKSTASSKPARPHRIAFSRPRSAILAYLPQFRQTICSAFAQDL